MLQQADWQTEVELWLLYLEVLQQADWQTEVELWLRA